MNQKNKNILMLAGAITALVLILIISFLVPKQNLIQKTKIITDKNEYRAGDVLKIKIKNDLKTNICFSSCYPYYFEKKDGVWKKYQYPKCPKEDIAKPCAQPKSVKAFELAVPSSVQIKKGIHRLAIPACVGCNLYEKFKKNKWFYSNKFIIK